MYGNKQLSSFLKSHGSSESHIIIFFTFLFLWEIPNFYKKLKVFKSNFDSSMDKSIGRYWITVYFYPVQCNRYTL